MPIVDLSRDMIAQRLVQSSVVKLKILAKPVPGLTYLMVIVQIDLLVLYAAPQTFHTDEKKSSADIITTRKAAMLKGSILLPQCTRPEAWLCQLALRLSSEQRNILTRKQAKKDVRPVRTNLLAICYRLSQKQDSIELISGLLQQKTCAL